MASWSDCRIKALPLGKSFSPTEEPEPHTVVSDNIIDVVKELSLCQNTTSDKDKKL